MIPYRPRWLNRLWADLFGYFWIDCPLCGEPFGGHEWRDNSIIWKGDGTGKGFCRRHPDHEIGIRVFGEEVLASGR